MLKFIRNMIKEYKIKRVARKVMLDYSEAWKKLANL